MAHPFFRGLRWAALEARAIEPPFRPKVASPMDVTNFDALYLAMPAADSPADAPLGTCSAFANFSYVAPAYLARLDAALLHGKDSPGRG